MALVFAIAPSLLILAFVSLADRSPKRFGALILAIVAGAFAIVPVHGFVEFHAIAITNVWLETYPVALYRSFVFAALPEELSKFVLLWSLFHVCRPVREPIHGLVYGTAIALGFASVESLASLEGASLQVLASRATTTIPCHAALGMIMGDYLGQAELAPPGARAGLRARALIFPILLHGMYDAPLLLLRGLGEQASVVETRVILVYVYVLLTGMIVHALWRLHRLRSMQRDASPSGRLPGE
ncbi:PrsW family intramembrane metalloprotease [Nannocystaceae bacterium ST9]